MALGLELTDDEMARVMEMREKWSDEERIERAAGMTIRAMVELFEVHGRLCDRIKVRQRLQWQRKAARKRAARAS